MFGIFYVLFNGIMSGINGVDRTFANSANRERAIQSGDLTYYGRDGGLYLCENGKHVYKSINQFNGHEIIKDFRTGKTYYDLTRVKIELYKDKKREEGKTVYHPYIKAEKEFCQDELKRVGIIYGIYGYEYEVDIETEHVLSKININGYYFYMDLITGKLTRLVDEYKTGIYNINTAKGKLSPETIINMFNQRQDKLKNDHRYLWKGNEWTKEVFYLCSNRVIYMMEDGKLVKKYLKETDPEGYNRAINDYNKALNDYKNIVRNNYYSTMDSSKMLVESTKKRLDSYDPVPLKPHNQFSDIKIM